MSLAEEVKKLVERHDLRRWMRVTHVDGSFDHLRCYCGFTIREDSNEAMFRHIADELLALLDQHAVAEPQAVATSKLLVEKFRAHARECETKPRGHYSAAVEVEWCADEVEEFFAAHAAEQPKLTEPAEQIREASEWLETYVAYFRDTGDPEISQHLAEIKVVFDALLAVPVAPPPRRWKCTNPNHDDSQEGPCNKVEVCGMCGAILEEDYCASCDAHVDEEARDVIQPPLAPGEVIEDGADPVRRDEFSKWVKALEAYPSSASDTRTLLVYKFAERIKEQVSYIFSAPGEQPPQRIFHCGCGAVVKEHGQMCDKCSTMFNAEWERPEAAPLPGIDSTSVNYPPPAPPMQEREARKEGHSALRWNKAAQKLETFDPHPSVQEQDRDEAWRGKAVNLLEVWGDLEGNLLVDKFAAALATAAKQAREGALEPFAKLLDGLNPFEGGRDGDECIWCHREHPKDIRTWQEGHLAEHHAEDCEFIVAIQALAAQPEQQKEK